ncbi:MAG: hypothetical protein HYS17_04035 [Micavibrio aeruginosavorus]|uniref:Uncharacterized protein n=1 Tax=Micavibrio aeruginosavorus TaxID=349221 RepID=A0A7T5UH54_9BACT|nr:MAG: hypothetical protein HYS17_04035 [Micavibrio aeruginosavorus]
MSGCERGIGARVMSFGITGPFVSVEFHQNRRLPVWTLAARLLRTAKASS